MEWSYLDSLRIARRYPSQIKSFASPLTNCIAEAAEQ